MKHDVPTGDLLINLNDYKSNVTSQYGEDGIISKVFETIGIRNRVCVDVGASDLVTYSNTRQLWKDQGWIAVLIEGNPVSFERMMRSKDREDNIVLLNKYVATQGDNSLDSILSKLSLPKEFDLLSIDVDGIDYHIWKSLRQFRPRVVVIEYNPTIPPHLVVIGKEHGNYIGASARALVDIGLAKGYALVACTRTNVVFTLDGESRRFRNVNNLYVLFDYSDINYIMTSYDGGLFYSNKSVPYGHNVFSNEVKGGLENVENYYVPSNRLSYYMFRWIQEHVRRLKRGIFKTMFFALMRMVFKLRHRASEKDS